MASMASRGTPCEPQLASGCIASPAHAHPLRALTQLPPDSSWSDFADSTPLETPALSRAGSISHSFSRKPSILTAQWPTSGRIDEDENAPSDPEDGDEWSSDSGASSPEEVMQQQAGPSRRTVTSPPRAAPPAQQQLDDGSYRKRSISSSSAFGSRARVRFSNLKKSNRRRPLSFQAALRSLTSTNESDDLANLAREHRRQGLPEGHERRSFQGPPGAVDVAARPSEEEAEEEIAASHSSAPAAAEGSGSVGMSASASTKAMPPPPVPVEKKAAAATTASRDSSSSRRANFFLSSSVSKSLDDDDEPSQQPAPAAAAAPPPQPTSQQVAPAAPPPLKPNKSKTDLSHGHRKSASGGSSKGKQSGHGRGSSGRLSALHGLTMTKTQPQVHAHAHAGPSKKASSKAPSRPVKFALGGGDDDDDDFTDEEDEPQPPAKPQAQQVPAPAPAPAPAPTEPAAADESAPWEDDDDGWSSDTSAEAEEERRKAAAAAERRRKLDEERQQNMFKKIPVRSQSAADVRYLADHGRSSSDVGPRGGGGREVAQEQEVEEPLPQQVPVRGLLSSLFHPEQEPHSPPGQLHGRPHASAADLRARPAQEQQQQQHKPAQSSRPPRPQRPSSKSGEHHRPPSLIAGTPSNDNGGPLRPSKSAAALPVLNVAAPDGGAGAPDVFESGSLIQQTSFEERNITTGGGAARSKSRERPPQASGSTSREAPAVAEHRAAAPVPAPIAPQTPRTTRRNMLRDELSESLRQNLLWERQSRNRMLGIGATAAREQSAPAPTQQQQQQQAPPPKPHRRETVLGGNTLRPLTQAQGSTSGQQQQQQQRPRPHSSGSGPVGEHSRSTSSLPRTNSNAAPTDLTPGAQQLSSAETSDEEEGNGRIGGGDDHHHHAYPHGNSGSMSSSGGATVGGSGGNSAGGTLHGHGHGGQKKKVMWPGGFPNYHQHGW